jgi:hypothetical protein
MIWGVKGIGRGRKATFLRNTLSAVADCQGRALVRIGFRFCAFLQCSRFVAFG